MPDSLLARFKAAAQKVMSSKSSLEPSDYGRKAMTTRPEMLDAKGEEVEKYAEVLSNKSKSARDLREAGDKMLVNIKNVDRIEKLETSLTEHEGNSDLGRGAVVVGSFAKSKSKDQGLGL